MVPDDELIREILKGSQAAMEVLVKKYYKAIYAYVYRNIGEYHTAYDITQEIFIKMMKNIKSYHEQGKFKNWLMKIAMNACGDYYRSASYKRLKVQEQLDEDTAEEEGSVLDMLERNLERQRVKEAVLELPDYQRDSLILKYYHDMKIKDIAQVTGAREASVKSRLRQGMEKLRNILKRGEECEKARDGF